MSTMPREIGFKETCPFTCREGKVFPREEIRAFSAIQGPVEFFPLRNEEQGLLEMFEGASRVLQGQAAREVWRGGDRSGYKEAPVALNWSPQPMLNVVPLKVPPLLTLEPASASSQKS